MRELGPVYKLQYISLIFDEKINLLDRRKKLQEKVRTHVF